MRSWRAISGLVSLVVALLTPCGARGLVFDWNSASIDWTSGALTGYFELDASNPGPDVSIIISGTTGNFVYSTPDDTTFLTGGQGTGQESLRLAVNHGSENSTITVTYNFHYAQGVTGVQFMLFDIDYLEDSYRDLISNIYGQYDLGTKKAASITGSSDNTVTSNNTLNATIRGDDSVNSDDNDGNATINFGTNIVNSFSFTYGNYTPSSPSNPGEQWIGLYDIINFTPRPRLPEAGTSAALGGLLLMAIILSRRRLRRLASAS